jgi:hypothetical protein
VRSEQSGRLTALKPLRLRSLAATARDAGLRPDPASGYRVGMAIGSGMLVGVLVAVVVGATVTGVR